MFYQIVFKTQKVNRILSRVNNWKYTVFLMHIPIQEGTAVQAGPSTAAITVTAPFPQLPSGWVGQQAWPKDPETQAVPGDCRPCSLHTPLLLKRKNGKGTNGWEFYPFAMKCIPDTRLQKRTWRSLFENTGNSAHSGKTSTQTSGWKVSWSWGFGGAMQTPP